MAIRADNTDALNLYFPKMTKEMKEECLSISVSSNSQKCFNYLCENGITSYELMQYTSNYENYLKMMKVKLLDVH